MESADFWIISIAALVGISCSIVGVFLVLQRLSMLGDAISHTVLFGLVTAFLLTQSRAALAMAIGAIGAGLLTTYVCKVLHKKGKLQEDASIGVSFTFFFAVGVILISAFAGQVDIDAACVLYGEIAFTPFDTLLLFGHEIGPKAFWILLAVTLLNIGFLFVGYRALKTISFDSVLAATLGFNVLLWHYLLMTFVSLTTVAAFESVGAILVIAMLVVPANTAYLFASSLSQMIWGSIAISILSAVGGYFLAMHFDASISAAMAMTAGAFFLIAVIAKALQNRPSLVLKEI